MTRPRIAVAILVSLALLGGCAPQYSSPQQAAANACSAFGPKALSGALIGGLGGAAGGAAIGAAAGRGRGAAIGAGVGLLAGVLGGMAVGNNLDQRDCQQAQIAIAQTGNARIGQAVTWSSPSGSYGSYTPTGPVYTASNGSQCRPVRSDYAIQGHSPVQDNGTVCRTAEGDYVRA